MVPSHPFNEMKPNSGGAGMGTRPTHNNEFFAPEFFNPLKSSLTSSIKRKTTLITAQSRPFRRRADGKAIP
jgi:hypothetical protein